MPSNRTAPLVAVLCIGVQGKILFVVRALLLKKVRKPLTRPSAPLEPVLLRVREDSLLYPSHGTPTQVSIPGGL